MSLKSSWGIKFRSSGQSKFMSARAQVIMNLPNLRKMLMEDVAWVSDHCPKQACISIAGQVQSSRADCGGNPLRFSLFINCSMRSRSRAEEKPHRTLNDTGINHGQTRHNTPVACNVTTLIEIIDHPVQAYTHKKIFNLVAEQTINLIVLGCVLVSTCIIVSLSWVSGRYLNYP